MNRAMITAVDELATGHGLQRQDILQKLEEALREAYEQAHPGVQIQAARIHPRTGDTEIQYEGTWLEVDFSEGDLGRISAMAVRRSLMNYLDAHDTEHALSHYEPLVGSVVMGRVEHSDRRGTWVKLQDADGFVPARHRHTEERLQRGQRKGFVVLGVQERGGKPEVVLSRADNRLIPGLLAMHVPEIESGYIRVRDYARDPGHRSLVILEGDEGIPIIPTVRGVGNNRLRGIRSDLGAEMLDLVVYKDKDSLQDKLRSLWMPIRLVSYEYDEDEEGVVHNFHAYVYDEDLERAQAVAPLIGEIINTRVEVSTAERLPTQKHRPVSEALLHNQCEYITARGKRCPNQAVRDGRCNTHQAA
jgi:transcription antitermination factor NusA-like protein